MLRREMRGKLIAAAVAVTGAVGAIGAPAATAQTEFFYRVSSANVSYSVDFDGEGARGCDERGVCDVSGRATYTFPRQQAGFGLILFSRDFQRASGGIGLYGRGRTEVTLGADTDPTPCRDVARHRYDELELRGRRGRMTVLLHPYEGESRDYLDTICGGPGDDTLRRAGAMPRATVRLRPFRRRVVRFRATSVRPFEADGFRGTVTFSMRFVLRRVGTASYGPRFTG